VGKRQIVLSSDPTGALGFHADSLRLLHVEDIYISC